MTGLFGHNDKSCNLLKEIIKFSAMTSEPNKKKARVPFGQ